MSHSQNSFLKTLDKHRLENSEGEGELLSYAGDAESYLPVDGAKDTAQPLRSTSGTAACRGRGQPGSNMGRGCMFADGPDALRLSSVLHNTWEPRVGMFLISAVSMPACCVDAALVSLKDELWHCSRKQGAYCHLERL